MNTTMPSHKAPLIPQNFFPVVETHNLTKSTFLHSECLVLFPEWLGQKKDWGKG